MRQKHLLTAIACQSDLFHDVGLFRFRNRAAVKVCALSVALSLKLLEAPLIVEPFVGEQLAAIHAPDGNDHCIL